MASILGNTSSTDGGGRSVSTAQVNELAIGGTTALTTYGLTDDKVFTNSLDSFLITEWTDTGIINPLLSSKGTSSITLSNGNFTNKTSHEITCKVSVTGYITRSGTEGSARFYMCHNDGTTTTRLTRVVTRNTFENFTLNAVVNLKPNEAFFFEEGYQSRVSTLVRALGEAAATFISIQEIVF